MKDTKVSGSSGSQPPKPSKRWTFACCGCDCDQSRLGGLLWKYVLLASSQANKCATDTYIQVV